MKAAAAREVEDGLGNDAAGIGDSLEAGLKVVAIEDDQRLGRRLAFVGLKTAVEPSALWRRIGWPIIGEGPAEGLAVKRLQRPKIGGGKFDIVDVVVASAQLTSSQTVAGFSATSSISAMVRTL